MSKKRKEMIEVPQETTAVSNGETVAHDAPVTEQTEAPAVAEPTEHPNEQPEAIEAVEATEATAAEPEVIVSQASVDAFYAFRENPNQLFYFRTNEINIDHSRNGRRKRRSVSDVDIKQLAENIKQHGILQPLLGRFDPETRAAYIVFGYGRYEATVLANQTLPEDQQILLPITFSQRLADGDSTGALVINISENTQRTDLTAIDIADDMKRLKDAGMQQTEIAQTFRMVKSNVTAYLSLLLLPDWVQDRIADGTLTRRHGLDLVSALKSAPTKEEGLKKAESAAKKLVEKANETGKAASTKDGREAAVEAGSSRGAAPMNFKEFKGLVGGSTGPGEDARVQVVNLVFSALLSGNSEKEHGIGKVSAKNFTTKLAAALDQVSVVKAVKRGKAA